jgi:predicted DNA-binding transcriptional regulator YafY
MRLIQLLDLLSSNRNDLTASELADQLQVTERTIYRYLSDLGVLYPIYNYQGYKMYKCARPPSAALTARDIQVLLLLLQSSPLSKHQDYLDQIKNLLFKLESMIQPHFEHQLPTIQSAESTPSVNHNVKMPTLERALSDNLVCEVLYQSYG